jgi:effector-binding domain-containing protein
MGYSIAVHDLAAQPVISIRGHAELAAEIPGFLGRSFGLLFGHLKLLGVEPAGPPFVIYHAFGPAGIDAEVCVPVRTPIAASGGVQGRVIPALTVARTLHVGPYEALASAYDAVTDWIRGRGFELAGPMRERYLNGPGDNVTPAQYQTEVEIPVVAVAVAVSG